jgi:predicted nuclease of predicted toxin-antitoxin system
MPRTIRLHLDEHVNPAIADGLRRRGIDVTTTADAGLLGADDTDHLAHAVRQCRVIFTNDSDFIILHDNGAQHFGIAYCRLQSRSVGQIIRTLELIWDILEIDEMRNRLEYV